MSTRRSIVASRIREARRLAGLSQAQVARFLGLHRPSVTEMEAGNRGVSVEEIAALADLFEVSTDWLMGNGAEKLDPQDDRLHLAARELKKLKPDQLERLLRILASLRIGDSDDRL